MKLLQRKKRRDRHLNGTSVVAGYSMKNEIVIGGGLKKKKEVSQKSKREKFLIDKANAYLLVYQWDKIVNTMSLGFNPSNQPVIQIKAFRAVLKECLLQTCNISLTDEMFWFEIIIAYHNPDQSNFWTPTKKLPENQLLQSELLFRMKLVRKQISRNDKVILSTMLKFYPDIKKKMKQYMFCYSDLLNMGEDLYMKLRMNFTNPELIDSCPDQHQISHFIQKGQLKLPQKSTSQFRLTSRQYLTDDYPILLCRKPFTSKPLRILCIMMIDKNTPS